jgi:hypothetical protein
LCNRPTHPTSVAPVLRSICPIRLS